jgi:hypothetical protein
MLDEQLRGAIDVEKVIAERDRSRVAIGDPDRPEQPARA